ncbi:putative transposase [Shigella sonnei 53G]|nr:putative transposase [Shigella sonnei 53G]EFZ50026.1 putative transposase [Shigella sonnei 53G]EFZ50329.1 putative transposase [Shigella sonnei 53G]EFZ50533.1 putative transposase [Shigella sonnei 53G]EFZ50681.1 putative transposase [Shigella sonnei 53G]
MYDGVFEVLQWLLFLSAVPPVQLLTGWCVTAKALPDISAISALTAVKHGKCSSLTPLLNPVRTRKSLIWP